MLESKTLKSRVALVTGATGALGRSVVTLLLEQGALVVAAYRDARKYRELEDSAGDLRAGLSGVEADVTVEEDVDRLVAEVIRARAVSTFSSTWSEDTPVAKTSPKRRSGNGIS